ncbi:ribonuclease III [Thermosulfidibacter takaii ABI70S6]|uniref:Ribonuclease 3 n=1 Tax=Thermosulfidibacter takaii (strain DSM 17441 / JCM 13301 / NBRC 103674 / ABI70S6) TaxID=1298851 RepID=A0A0S3QUX2_THET7|nr:ribonuclease III [Thermosulfidibacter takaii]BAT72111.1 ribonuclease III [Thermosulfidibacter takaii ABI70S6]
MLASYLEKYEARLNDLQEKIGYRFREREILLQALIHRSFAKEEGIPQDNERLEFLGDAFINFVVGFEVFKSLPDGSEGELTKKRAMLVREEALAWAARKISLGDYLLLGRGEERQGGRERASNLADAFEALIGAVLVDGGVAKARSVVRRLLVRSGVPEIVDYKSRLLELCHKTRYPRPSFRFKKEVGRVKVEVSFNGFRTVVYGANRKEAERFASKIAYVYLRGKVAHAS